MSPANPISIEAAAAACDGRISNISGPLQCSDLADSSRQCTPGSLFVAVEGAVADGHDFLDDAFERGAHAAVVSREAALQGRPGIVVSDTRCALSRLSAHFFGDPSREMLTLGVTGTNGKTTTHFLLYQLLDQLGFSGVRIGTIGIEAKSGFSEPGGLTTPSAIAVQSTLARAKAGGAEFAVVETSSHALDQLRVGEVWYDAGVFTNLTPDHLDYHPSMEQYLLSKLQLFDLVARSIQDGKPGNWGRGAVVGIDHPYGEQVVEYCRRKRVPCITFSASGEASIRIHRFDQNLQRSRMEFSFAGKRYEIESRLLGRYNGLNLCAAFGAAVTVGLEPDRVAEILGNLAPVPGRLEPVGNERVAVFVDYAHTPDALENALCALKEFTQGRLWVVFGAGGDRDPGRRAGMGQVAKAHADCVVVTSDNPRTEDPLKIIDGILESGVRAELVEPDRRKAIEETLSRVQPGDVVLIAGKGHEDYQIIGTERRHFSDREEVERLRSAGVF